MARSNIKFVWHYSSHACAESLDRDRYEQVKGYIDRFSKADMVSERHILEIAHVLYGIQYRKNDIRINKKWMTRPNEIALLMSSITPVKRSQDMRDWYERFIEVYPFEDKNRCIGGIIVAALSFNGRMLLPA